MFHRRRIAVPLVTVALVAGLRAALFAAQRTEALFGTVFALTALFQIALSAAPVVLLVWLFLLGRFTRRTKLVVTAILLVVGGGFAAAVRRVEFNGQMRPIPVFRWEPSADERLAEYQSQEAKVSRPLDATPRPGDSPGFRGPAGTGITPGATVGDRYTVKWRRPAGAGHGGIAVSGEAVATIEQQGSDEVVLLLDRQTGAERWSYRYPAQYKTTEPMGGGGPRTTPVIHDDAVYALGALGELACLDAATGTLSWRVNAVADSQAALPAWAISGSPLIVGDTVIVNPGADPSNNQNRAVVAYDLKTGARRWATGAHPAAYASPSYHTLAGVEQVVVFDAAGLGGHDPATGAELWRYPWESDVGMNSAQPVAVGPNRLLVSSEKSNGAAVLELTRDAERWQVRPVWQKRTLFARYSTPLFLKDTVYGLSDGRLVALDAATGERLYAEGDFGNGQLLSDGTRIAVSAEPGDVAIVDPAGRDTEVVFKTELFGTRTWNMPALAGSELFVRNHREIACLVTTTPGE